MLCQLEVSNDVVLAAARDAELLRAERRAGAADRPRARPADRQPRSSTRSCRAASSSPSPTARTARRSSRTASRSPARRRPPSTAVDGTAAGDAFAACLVVSLLEERPRDEALRRACAAGALAASRLGAQPSLPTAARTGGDTRAMTPTPIILDCDPGHDDAIAILLALASPELELVGVTTVSGNQTLDKTTANALRVLELAGRSGHPGLRGRRRAVRAAAGRRGARARRVRARRARPARPRAARPVRSTRSSTSPSSSARRRRRRSSRPAR